MSSTKTKKCSGCNASKTLSEFTKRSASPDGLHYYCRQCAKVSNERSYQNHRDERKAKVKAYYHGLDPASREKKLAYQRKWQRENHDKCRDNMLQWKLGISLSHYDRMLEKQGGGCAICGSKNPGKRTRSFAVDHDHTTGEVRGLLCQNCNRGLGFLGDDIVSIKNVLRYLKRGKTHVSQ